MHLFYIKLNNEKLEELYGKEIHKAYLEIDGIFAENGTRKIGSDLYMLDDVKNVISVSYSICQELSQIEWFKKSLGVFKIFEVKSESDICLDF